MKKEHKEIAVKWFREHETHVMKMVILEDPNIMYAPSEEDISQPSLWKPAHWKWFFTNVLYN